MSFMPIDNKPFWYGKESMWPCAEAYCQYVAYVAFIFLIASMLAPPASAMNFSEVHADGVYPNPSGGVAYHANKSADGNLYTYTNYLTNWDTGQRTWLVYHFPSATTLYSCEFRPYTSRTLWIDNDPTKTFYATAGQWNTYNFNPPLNVGTDFLLGQANAAAPEGYWVRINETRCYGYNATVNDNPNQVDFNATPLSGNTPLSVIFIDNSTNAVQTWTFGDNTSVTGNYSQVDHTYSISGNYTVSLTAFNATYGWGSKTKQDYIMAINANASSETTGFQAYDGITHGALMGASIYIYDQTTMTWSNSTSDADGLHTISAYSDHLLDAYATKSGYSQGQVWDVYSTGDIYPINLYPSGMIGIPGDGTPGDPGVGNVNLIVNVYDKNNGNQPIDGATVTIIPPTGGQQTRLTSSAGAAIFVVPNLSTISVTATKSGYSSKSDSIVTTIYGPDTLSLGLTRFVATPTVTVTGTDGVPVTTVIPGCEDPTSSTCYAARDTEMANDVRDWIEILIPIAGIMTILYLMGWKP